MKSIIGLLLGLSVISFAEETDDKNEQFSWDSGDDGTTQTYNGLVIQVYQPDDEALVITLASGTDADRTYCLNFVSTYEAIFEDPTCREDCTFEIISGTQVNLLNANCTVKEKPPTEFIAICNDVLGATLTLDFTFKQDEDGEYGLEYTIDLSEDYTISEGENVKFVMEQSVKDCSIEFPDSGDSGDNSEEDSGEDGDDTDDNDDPAETDDGDNDTTDADEDETQPTNTEDRRRLQDGDDNDNDIVDDNDNDNEDDDDNDNEDDDVSNSEDEEAGISSDDSKEYDVGLAQFIISGVATDVCSEPASSTQIDSYIVDQDDSLQIVFGRFECGLKVDPRFKLDESKLSESHLEKEDDGANMRKMVGAMFIAVICLFLF